ncbi:MAG: F-type H+-transporting ATPase subunit a [Actinomycetota bacterium]|nr:F-type H+-transporting ATPase subunit a [Actinomycetota bacterium]
MILGILAAVFEPPSTKDFVFDCFFGGKLFGIDMCFNFVTALVVASVVIFIAIFLLAFRRPKVVPGKFQALMEMGLSFVREQIALPMLGHDADKYMAFLATLFFFILIGNLFEVAPWVNFSANSRVAYPLVMAVLAWVVYNVAGVRKHGFFGYLKFTCIIPAAPGWLRYSLLMVIEFISNIIIRPITLTVRLAANFIAGHFLLAIFFLGDVFFLKDGPKTWGLLVVSGPLSLILVAFEVFVALLQAFIFAMLTASYIGGVLAEEH